MMRPFVFLLLVFFSFYHASEVQAAHSLVPNNEGSFCDHEGICEIDFTDRFIRNFRLGALASDVSFGDLLNFPDTSITSEYTSAQELIDEESESDFLIEEGDWVDEDYVFPAELSFCFSPNEALQEISGVTHVAPTTEPHNKRRRESESTPKLKYPCDLCEMRFPRQRDLTDHRTSIHTKTKPYICECGAGFTQKGNMRTHKRKRCHLMSQQGEITTNTLE